MNTPSNAARIIKIVADYYGQPIAEVHLDTRLRSLTDHEIDRLDIHEIVGDIEEVFKCESFEFEAYPVASETLTARDFLRMVEPEDVGP